MNPSPSPPQEAEHIRHQQLTPESPRPQNVPSPANIPILELQMDPNFHESSHNNGNGTSTPASQYASHSQTPNPFASAPYLSDPTAAANHQTVGAQSVGGTASGYAQSATAYGDSTGTQAQGTSSIQNFSAQHQSRAASTNDATHSHSHSQPPGQDVQSAYPYAHENAYAAQQQQASAQSAPGAHYQPEGNGATSVDVQALLDSLTPAMQNAQAGHYAAPPMTSQNNQAQPNAPQASLPPRPPAQGFSYNPNDDIRSFHPHSQQTPNNPQQLGNGQPQNLTVAAQSYAPMSQEGAQGAAAQGSAPKRQGQRSETPDDEDIRWPPEVNRRYEDFLDQERKFVTEGQWDQFPMGSRLFIGNLPTEKVTKRDIFHRFYRHGRLAQISIKQAYGFVQFLDSESCRRALDAEQGQAVRGRKMHLEISKPQKNSRKAEPQPAAPRRRSRSPDYTRGGTAPTPRDGRYGGNQGPMSPRDRERRFREREDYRPMRSPSPRGVPRGMRSRDRSRERFETRDSRYRSRSRTPPRRRRSPSPRQDYTEDDLDLRRRLPHEVPDIQILVLHEGISRDFIRYVEDIFRQQGLRSNVLIMSGRFPEPAVVRRQIIEGVLAIVRMDTSGFKKGKVSVQIFDRRGGANNVQFNEYADLDPTTAALLVNNAKQTQSQPVQPPAPTFGFNRNMPPFNPNTQNPFTAAPASQPNISNIITSLDPASLSQLLGAMSAGNNVPQNQQPGSMFNPDLARLLAQVSSPVQTPGFGTSAPPQMPQLNHFPGLAAMLAGQAQPAAPPVQNTPQPGGAPADMSEIMAQLAQGSTLNSFDVVHKNVPIGSMLCNMLITKKSGALIVLLCPTVSATTSGTISMPTIAPVGQAQSASAGLQTALHDPFGTHRANAAAIPEPYNPAHPALASPFVFDPRRDSGNTAQQSPRSPTTARPRARQSAPCMRPHDL
ncbi:hypothetical protein HBI88_214690 [Parastagonospora nodorum]|nr:hypothetical protein HBI97_225850 [Parastagonospora nodorum]KAH5786816.1 hypothetical protein HBI96_231680 [Parastagonospora nodorum]KAH5801241.1 hypothetical protein HBI94_214200 [Parastagonospora nodorum]KAH5810546.1 hypothetical protein HBI93_228990 [Parastagonospora nodorum]KAH5848991.1 hypothetical protein HBI90_226540 [Parastagonospora nodorum]